MAMREKRRDDPILSPFVGDWPSIYIRHSLIENNIESKTLNKPKCMTIFIDDSTYSNEINKQY